MGGGNIEDKNMNSTCPQGSPVRPLGGYQPNLSMELHPAVPAWQLYHRIFPKQEPMDEDRNDSGITSGSEFHSSSPGSETSQDYNPTATYSSSQNTQNSQTSTYYSTPLMSRFPSSSPAYRSSISRILDHQSIIPPSFNNNQVPQTSNQDCVKGEGNAESMETENLENEDPLRSLEFALENTGLVPQPSPSPDLCDDDAEYLKSLHAPRMNSHGKVKSHKCKNCNFVAITKFDFWTHIRTHMNPDKILSCQKCPFVTEYKHHLEYHLRNHMGSKPYKCDKCNYSCVNKSMLNSHMKSHSNVYQYRCADCVYASKYCHSLKLHLRKYRHRPAMVLNPDGTPNPYPIVDVYGTRRGPKQKPASKPEGPRSSPRISPRSSPRSSPRTSPRSSPRSPPRSPLQNPFAQFVNLPVPQMPLPIPYHLFAGLQNPLLFPFNFENTPKPPSSPAHKPEQERFPSNPNSPPCVAEETSQALDLSKPAASPKEEKPLKNRRKGRAYKLKSLPVTDSSGEEDDAVSKVFNNHIALPEKSLPEKSEEIVNNNDNTFSCPFCNINYGDIVMYTIHMGYHDNKDPFTCNMCGEKCKDKLSLFLHIARVSHK